MSSIAFNFRDGRTVRISGADRAYLGQLTDNIALVCSHFEHADVYEINESLGTKLNPGDSHTIRKLEMAVHDGRMMTIGGQSINRWDAKLNTCLALRSPALWLAARIHAQCEIHGFIPPDHLHECAEIILRGLGTVFRTDARGYDGWEVLAHSLSTHNAHPVVMSYSVCADFPDWPMLDDGLTDNDIEKIPHAEQFARCSALLDDSLAIRPRDQPWPAYYFGAAPLTLFGWPVPIG